MLGRELNTLLLEGICQHLSLFVRSNQRPLQTLYVHEKTLFPIGGSAAAAVGPDSKQGAQVALGRL